MTTWYVLRTEDSRFVTNDTRTGIALTSNLALAYVWEREERAEAERTGYQAILGHRLLVDVKPSSLRPGI